MLKIKHLLLFVLLSCVSLPLRADVILVNNGKAAAKIYHAPLSQSSMSPASKGLTPKALNELSTDELDAKMLAVSIADMNYHFKKMAGIELEVVVTDNPKDIKTPAIVIGKLADRMGATPAVKDDPSKEAFRLVTKNDMVLIGGSSDAGSSYGIHTFLEKLGCAWVMPGVEGEVIPKKKTVVVPSLDMEEAPSFGNRDIWYGGRPSDLEWEELNLWILRQKCNFRLAERRWGFSGGSHAWGAIIRRFKEEFQEHPEMMALVRKADGSVERGGNQLESTHPRVIELAIEYIREQFKKNSWPNDKEVCIGMGPNDGGSLSLSPETINAGVDRVVYGSGKMDGTDICILFINTILERTAKEFPNLHLGLLIYSWHADYPLRYKPHPRLVAGIADINYSRLHGTFDETSKSRGYYTDVLRQWSKLHKEQGNWLAHGNYNWNLADAVMPYTKVKIYGEDFPFRKQMGVSVMGMNLTTDWYLSGAHTYVMAKMAWDVSNDWKQVLREYCEKSYGVKAAPFMEKYYRKLAQSQSESSQETGSFYSWPLIYDHTFIAEQESNFDDALALAETNIQKKRITWARYPLTTLKHYLRMRDAYVGFDFPKAQEEFETAVAVLEEISEQNIHFRNKSGKGYFGGYSKYITESNLYSSGKNHIIYKFPNVLKTAIDVDNLGAKNRFWSSKIDDSSYLKTQTYLSTWDAQGLSGFPVGSTWYRVHFKLDELPKKGEGVGLFLGGADNQAAVWCNDKFIGRSSAGPRMPTQYDITDAVRPVGEDNVLVIQVIKPKIWELYTGGIMMPSFIFTGPRVEPTKDTEPPFRILPGGVKETINDVLSGGGD